MNLRTWLGTFTLFAVACSGPSSTRPQHGDAGSTSSHDANANDANANDAGPCLSIQGAVFAIDTLYFGDLDWDGREDNSAWMLFGSNLDGLDSNASPQNHCQPAAGASPESVYTDGKNGIDNSFGKTIVPLLASVSPSFSSRVNDAIANGVYSWLFKLDPFDAKEASVSTKVFAADSLENLPSFDGTDCWPIARSSLNDVSDIESATVSFPGSKLVQGQLTTSSLNSFQLTVPISGTTLVLTAHHAKIEITFEDDPSASSRGRLSGIVDTEEFIEEARDVLGFMNPDMCSGPAFESVATSIRRASDIMKDGTQDPASTCNGISIGLGFTMTRAGIRGVGPAIEAGVDPCP
ncbi:MAG TPA: hypothetical protein PKL73_15385 [Polyangiaceae bacterium]|nr:MAG: hypothetical protein BWY17_03027 [Deltaproteobacteria bacterium ADurb.Bin207]HNS98334.1 hypothetical protein [Polyangiaceae bacterium]HNZ23241.1 hypothetical protein [Polyangiaceae bacterium]HOD23325.1 hypothetical protein [Polyangiaceae bacterium]HOE51320.1 hypothetical protein [Polyangiaceae bacterium]